MLTHRPKRSPIPSAVLVLSVWLPQRDRPPQSAALAFVQHDRILPIVLIGSGNRKISVKRSPSLMPSSSPKIRPLHHRPRKSLRIRLSQNLSNAFERAIALTIAQHLSAQSGQHVGLLDLVGLSLYVWSDSPIRTTSDLAASIQSGCPLQGWLVGKRSPQPAQSGGELAKAGVRLELLAIAS
jgi:hypothetical protein